MMKEKFFRRLFIICLIISAATSAMGQAKKDVQSKESAKEDSLKTVRSSEIVVSATRSEQNLENAAIPVSVISKKCIEQQGAMRLNEVLEEQTGLAIMYDHGTGVQLQGFSPAYTLILIDGEPVVGRTAGTLELTRFTVANIERIEIVKGPSSSLFGSEALGGVINITGVARLEHIGKFDA